MSIQAVLFDFDGTLADTLPLSFHAFQAVFQQYDHREVTRDELVAMFGPTEEDIIGGNFADPSSVPQAIEDYYSLYEQGHFGEFQNDQSITELLQALKAQGMKLGVITGKSRRAYQISAGALDLERFFDISITGDDVVKPKPDPEGIHSALRTLGIAPSNAVFVGDSNADILAGKAAGLQTYGVRWLSTFQSQAYDVPPDGVFDSVDEFRKLLKLNNIIAMTYHSRQQAADITVLEQQCSHADSVQLSSDLEHLVKEDGDHALLCYRGDQLIGLLSWFATEGDYAQINAMVHPEYRREGVFRSLCSGPRKILRLSPYTGSVIGFRAAHRQDSARPRLSMLIMTALNIRCHMPLRSPAENRFRQNCVCCLPCRRTSNSWSPAHPRPSETPKTPPGSISCRRMNRSVLPILPGRAASGLA